MRKSHNLCVNFSKLDKLTSFLDIKENSLIKIWEGKISESILIYSILESESFASLDCKVCWKGKVENEHFEDFCPISSVNQSRRHDSQKKPSTFASHKIRLITFQAFHLFYRAKNFKFLFFVQDGQLESSLLLCVAYMHDIMFIYHPHHPIIFLFNSI